VTPNGWVQIVLFFAAVLLATKPLGTFMHRVFEGGDHVLKRPLGWLETAVYRVCRVEWHEQSWPAYTGSMLAFSLFTMVVTYLIQRLQHVLPFNPQGLGAVEQASAFNTAASFTTNTNWQGYVGETTMSYFSQMAGLAWHNFISAAAGMAIAIALARGLTRRGEGTRTGTIGNFWVDLTRANVYVLLPLSIAFGLLFVSQGVIQNLAPYREVATLESAKQVLAMGPVASQEAIKQLGTNGGGFFNANAAHPFESPNALTNFLSLFLIFLIPAGLTYTFGRMARDQRQGWALLAAMTVLFAAGVTVAYGAEAAGNPVMKGLPVAQTLGNMEGKEARFGVANSALYATVTTDASCGAVNAMHDSFTPMGGLVPLFNMQLGEVIFGGVGAGLYGILVMAVLSVFIAGLMVGRTPEYLGKKIEAREVKYAMLYALIFPLVILSLAAWTVVVPYGLSSLNNAGPHGLSEILYAFTSGTANNGSAFAGISANTPWYNTTLALAMLFGRFWMIVPALALAGALAGKKTVPPGPGTLPTNGPIFVVLLIGVIVIVGALTFFPVLSLGPIVEHFAAQAGKVY
jgi:potassium-transporting ATPase potassium-binding subunit